MTNLNIADIVWENPPPENARGRKSNSNMLRDFAAILAMKPGEWARFPKLSKSGYTTSTFRSAGVHNVEATTRVVRIDGKRLVETYARYLPPVQQQVA
jgi:hypothetical protein